MLLLAFGKLVEFCYSRLAYSFAIRYLLGLQTRHRGTSTVYSIATRPVSVRSSNTTGISNLQ
jgi:hypothetical protein